MINYKFDIYIIFYLMKRIHIAHIYVNLDIFSNFGFVGCLDIYAWIHWYDSNVPKFMGDIGTHIGYLNVVILKYDGKFWYALMLSP